MAKTKISEFDSTPANNTDIDSINIAEGCAPSGINNAIRELMSQLKDQQTGASGDNFTVGGNLVVTGTSVHTGATTFTGAVVMSTALPVASGGTGATSSAAAPFAIKGANSDITSITGLTTALSAAQGGTGLTSSGTSGNILTSNGSTWTSSALPAGSTLQVVQGTVVTTTTSTSSSTFVTTGITVSITPKFSTSKILVFANTSLDCSASGRNALFTIYRNSTNVVDSGSSSGSGFSGAYGDTSRIQVAVGVTFLDSPSTTSATTYTIYVRSTSGSIVANPTCSGYVTVMEIAG